MHYSSPRQRRTAFYLITTMVVALFLSACGPLSAPFVAQGPVTATANPTQLPSRTGTPTAISTPSSTATTLPTSSPAPTLTPSPTFLPITPSPTLAPVAKSEREAVFQEVWELVRDRYVYDDYRGLDWAAVRDEFAPQIAAAETPAAFYNLMQSLIDRLGDDHSRFETPQDVAQEEASFEGTLNYVGIGAMIRSAPEGGLVTRLAKDGPAEQAGIKPRDLVVAIGSTPFTDTTAFGPDGPISAVRGAAGTTVRLTVRSPDTSERVVEIVRRPVGSNAFPQIEAQRLPNSDIALLRIDTFFLDDLDQQIRSALEAVLRTRPLTGIIIDVRANGGGRVDLMLNTIGLFADGGTIGWSMDRLTKRSIGVPQGNTMPQLNGIPVVILTSEDTVSAAEMFAAGMRALTGARIVGTTTAGNTENLRSHTLADGSRLWLAELAYLLPDNTPNEGHGVQPDQVIHADWWRYDLEDDPQIREAVRQLSPR